MRRVEDIQWQKKFLKTYRDMLAMLLMQIAITGEAGTAPAKLYERDHSRAKIARIKAVLGGWRETVDDHPDDLAPAVSLMPDAVATASGSVAPISQPNWQV